MRKTADAPFESCQPDDRRTIEQAAAQGQQTTPPANYVILYDGLCRFCSRQSRRLIFLARPGVIEAVNFQEAGALDRFPGITHDACMRAIHLVEPDGSVYRGFEAVVRAIATRPLFRWLAARYYLPGLRQILNGLYVFFAANRYRFWGKPLSSDECSGGTFHLICM